MSEPVSAQLCCPQQHRDLGRAAQAWAAFRMGLTPACSQIPSFLLSLSTQGLLPALHLHSLMTYRALTAQLGCNYVAGYFGKSRPFKTKIFCVTLPFFIFFFLLLLTSARKWRGIIFKPVFLPDPAWLASWGSLAGSSARWAPAQSCAGSPAPLQLPQHGISVNCLHKLTIILSLAIFKATMGPRVSKSQHWNPRAPWLLSSSGWLSVLSQWSGLLHIHLNILPRCYFKTQVWSTLNLCI